MKTTSRLTKPTDVLVQRLNASLPQDLRLHEEDIEVRKGWAKALLTLGILNAEEYQALIDGLQAIRSEFGTGEFSTLPRMTASTAPSNAAWGRSLARWPRSCRPEAAAAITARRLSVCGSCVPATA